MWFRYSDAHPWVLRGVSLRIPYGTATALAGLKGAGRSTLVELLCRFHDPTRGAILWGGVDIRDIAVTALRSRISAVFQDHMNYDMTAAENIVLGDVARLADRERIRSAAEQAGVHDRPAGLPRGYDTLLSRMFLMETDQEDERAGVMLSGGQWQRLALARAFLRDRPEPVILDEPSAGLDAAAEHEIHSTAGARAVSGREWLIKRVAARPGDPVPPGALPDDVSCGHVSAGRLVLLGDNREVSFDSRHLGCLPCERVLGTVVRRLSC